MKIILHIIQASVVRPKIRSTIETIRLTVAVKFAAESVGRNVYIHVLSSVILDVAHSVR